MGAEHGAKDNSREDRLIQGDREELDWRGVETLTQWSEMQDISEGGG